MDTNCKEDINNYTDMDNDKGITEKENGKGKRKTEEVLRMNGNKNPKAMEVIILGNDKEEDTSPTNCLKKQSRW